LWNKFDECSRKKWTTYDHCLLTYSVGGTWLERWMRTSQSFNQLAALNHILGGPVLGLADIADAQKHIEMICPTTDLEGRRELRRSLMNKHSWLCSALAKAIELKKNSLQEEIVSRQNREVGDNLATLWDTVTENDDS
jgi:hypothetical protein